MTIKRYIENKISSFELQMENLKEFKELLDEWNQIIIGEQITQLSNDRYNHLVQCLRGVYAGINPIFSENEYLTDGSHVIPFCDHFQINELISEIPSFSVFVQLPRDQRSDFVRRAEGVSCRLNTILPVIIGSLARRKKFLTMIVNLT